MQAARRKGNTMRDTRTRRGVERAARKATSTARASRALDGLLDLVALPVRGSELHAVSTGYSGGRVARNAIARVTPDDVTCYVALPFDERLIGGWRRKGRAAPELMEAPPSEAESERQAAGAEPSTTCPRLVFRSRASSAGIIGGRRSGAGEVVDCLSANAALVLAEALSRKPRMLVAIAFATKMARTIWAWPIGRWIIGNPAQAVTAS